MNERNGRNGLLTREAAIGLIIGTIIAWSIIIIILKAIGEACCFI